MVQKIAVTVLRSVIAYVFLLFLGRSIGRKLISRITFFDFIIGVILGSLAVRISLGPESSPLLGIVSAGTITCLVLLTDMLNLKSSWFRKMEEGEPIFLIQKGRLLDQNLSRAKISVSKLMMLLREKNVFYVEDVDYAVIENDGHLSVLLKPDRVPVTAGESKIPKSENDFPADIIVDGKIIPENLKSSCHDQLWLQKQLQSQGADSPEQVFYASVGKGDTLFVSKFQAR
jgi:uncharacterized membrane protein YcaP (DUF421 family)